MHQVAEINVIRNPHKLGDSLLSLLLLIAIERESTTREQPLTTIVCYYVSLLAVKGKNTHMY